MYVGAVEVSIQTVCRKVHVTDGYNASKNSVMSNDTPLNIQQYITTSDPHLLLVAHDFDHVVGVGPQPLHGAHSALEGQVERDALDGAGVCGSVAGVGVEGERG